MVVTQESETSNGRIQIDRGVTMKKRRVMSRKAANSLVEKSTRIPAGMAGDQSLGMDNSIKAFINWLKPHKCKATKNTNRKRKCNTKRQYKRR